MSDAAVGITHHCGWADAVTMTLADGAPVVLDRRRMALIEDGLPRQPYHHEALALPPHAAQALVDRVRHSALACARAEFQTLREELAPAHRLAAIALGAAAFDAVLPPTVAEVLAYRPLIYAADAMLYLETLGEAARSLGLTVAHFAKSDAFTRAGAALGIDREDAEALIAGLRATIGAPWTQDHRRAAAMALAAVVGVPGDEP